MHESAIPLDKILALLIGYALTWLGGYFMGSAAGRRAARLGLEYPCCEAANRIERIPGDATTLIGGECPIHGRTACTSSRPR